MNEFVIVYITNSSKEEARRVAKHLLEKRLVACANIFPIQSFYWWEGTIAEDEEAVVLAKTMEVNYEKVKTEVESIHSYSVPCVTKIKAQANEKYFAWLKGEVQGC